MIRSALRSVKHFVVGPPHRQPKPVDYWGERRQMRYYQQVLRLARGHAGNARSVLDVGPRDTPFVAQLDWIPNKTAIDLEYKPNIPGTDCIQGDFFQYHPPAPFDLVLCLQVLEHLDDPQTFVTKLFQTGRHVIISVPYKWAKGFCKWHVQDPVDEGKILSWTNKPWLEGCVATEDDHISRWIGVFKGADIASHQS